MHRHGRVGTCLLLVLVSALLPAPRSQAGTADRLSITDAHTLETVRRGAMERLRSPECRKVLTDFRDGEGRPLTSRLAVFAVAPDEYLARIAFLDGRRRPSCRTRNAELLTTPGAGRIHVCPSFLRVAWRDRTMAEVYVIHEMLHTLGLGEDPPTSRQITDQVERRCAP